MPSPYTTAGFYHSPVSKVLVGSSIISYFLVTFPFHQYRYLFVYDTSRVFLLEEIWRILAGKVVFLDAKDMLLGSMLFYNFRVFERRYGSRKFCSYLLATGLMSVGLELAMVYICRKLSLDIGFLPSGPLCLIYPMFVPHFVDVPRVAVAHLWSIPITGKSVTYIIGLQLASGSVESFMVAACGIAAGLAYRNNFMHIRSLVYVPRFISDAVNSLVGALLETPPPRLTEVSQGATLEIQRLQQTERLEQQILLAQMQHRGQPRWAFNFGLPFGHQPPVPIHVRHGHATHRSTNTETQHQPGTSRDVSASSAQDASEEQVTRLCEMGFNRDRVLRALHVSNNDISTATMVLLQDM